MLLKLYLKKVLILIVVDNSLVLRYLASKDIMEDVLILIVVDNGLILDLIRLY